MVLNPPVLPIPAPTLSELKAGDVVAAAKLSKAGHPEVWAPLTQHVLTGGEPLPALAEALWPQLPNVSEWQKRLRAAVDHVEHELSRSAVRGRLFDWLKQTVSTAFAPTHEAGLSMRVLDLKSNARDDGGFAEAGALYAELLALHAAEAQLAEVAMLVVKGARTVRNQQTAHDFAVRAQKHSKAAGNDTGANVAVRYQAGALLGLHQWTQALALYDEALKMRVTMFAGGGVSVSTGAPDERQAAIEEMQQIGLWATPSAPEWVRGWAGLAEAFSGEAIENTFQQRFVDGLARITAGSNALADLDVLIRQLRERGLAKSTEVTARAGVAFAPDDSLLHSVLANLCRDRGEWAEALTHYELAATLLEKTGSESLSTAWSNVGDVAASLARFEKADAAFAKAAKTAVTSEQRQELLCYRARSLRMRDPQQAITMLSALLDTLKEDKQAFLDGELGVATVRQLVELYAAQKDLRAVAVQQSYIDALTDAWGEAPEVWNEQFRLGTLHAELGNAVEARRAIQKVQQQFQAMFGDADASVQRCRDALANLVTA